MISVGFHHRWWWVAGLLTAFIGLAGCGIDKAPDFCKDHGDFHAAHRDELGTLSIVMNADGRLQSEVVLPIAVVGDSAAAVLKDVARVYSLQTSVECTVSTANVSAQDGQLRAHYESQCGTDNKIGQLDVHIFDALPRLEEIEVDITTPVARKHFAINRKCENAIFRLRKL